MLKARVIPVLLLKNGGLVKSVRFRNHRYIGDPINAVRIFNDKEVDELLIIDIDASRDGRGPDFAMLSDISREAFMPFGYGGGVRDLSTLKTLLHSGVEKVCVNQIALQQPDFLRAAADYCGSQSVVVAIDARKDIWGRYQVYDYMRAKNLRMSPWEYAAEAERMGAGEILLTNVDRDGSYLGYDLELTRKVADNVSIPVIALGGAASTEDLGKVVNDGHASAAAAGSLFVYYGPHRAVLINYPEKKTLRTLFP